MDSPVGVAVPLLEDGVLVTVSLTPSLVENIRVNRFVIDGFSADCLDDTAAACWGAPAMPLILRFSTLGTALPFWLVVGLDVGDPEVEEVIDAAGDRSGLSAAAVGLNAAMMKWSRVSLLGWKGSNTQANSRPRNGYGQCPAGKGIKGANKAIPSQSLWVS